MADVIGSKGDRIPDLVYARPEHTVREAIRTMRSYGVSQLPVAKGDMPLAAAEVMGSVSELRLMERVLNDADLFDQPVETIMSPPLPTIGAYQSLDMAVEALEHAPAMLVLDGGRPSAVVSSSDVLRFLSESAPSVDSAATASATTGAGS